MILIRIKKGTTSTIKTKNSYKQDALIIIFSKKSKKKNT